MIGLVVAARLFDDTLKKKRRFATTRVGRSPGFDARCHHTRAARARVSSSRVAGARDASSPLPLATCVSRRSPSCASATAATLPRATQTLDRRNLTNRRRAPRPSSSPTVHTLTVHSPFVQGAFIAYAYANVVLTPAALAVWVPVAYYGGVQLHGRHGVRAREAVSGSSGGAVCVIIGSGKRSWFKPRIVYDDEKALKAAETRGLKPTRWAASGASSRVSHTAWFRSTTACS